MIDAKILAAPCKWCGYNGVEYYQAGTHRESCPWHSIGGLAQRAAALDAAAGGAVIAALYVQRDGCYYGLPDVDPWDEQRDARTYAGPYPVVAHPPCARWCRLAGLVQARWGHKRGEDDGCFEAALEAVRTYGGVLEHPAYSDAWGAFGLNSPPTGGGWVVADFEGGWTCYVEQGRYGHRAKKATWLYAHGVELPSLRWGHVPDGESQALVSWCGNRTFAHSDRPRLGKAAAAATPDEFRDELIGIARTRKRGVGPVGSVGASVELQSKRERAATPEPFRDTLIAIARGRRHDQA